MNIVIVDDEPLARARLRQLCEKMDDLCVVAEAENGEDAIQCVQDQKPDIVLMDIRMPGMDGLEATRHINEMRRPPAIIFTTAFGDHALDAFASQAVGYVLKPIKQEELENAINSAQRLSQAQITHLKNEEKQVRQQICVKVRGTLELVPVDQIRFFLADHKYVVMRTCEHEYLIEEPLKSLDGEFSEQFTRIHRNALVSNHHITGLEKTNAGQHLIVLDGVDEKLEISRRHLSTVKKKVKELVTYR